MNLLALVAIAALGMPTPQPQQAIEVAPPPLPTATETADVPRLDLRAAAKESAAEIVAQERDPVTGQFVAAGWQDPAEPEPAPEEQTGYFGMLYQNSYDPSVLAYYAASTADIWSRYELQQTCDADPYIECTDGWPGNVSTEVLLTGMVYMGATGIQRLAKKYWDVDLDDGWKNFLIFGGLAAVRLAMTWDQVSNTNAIREF